MKQLRLLKRTKNLHIRVPEEIKGTLQEIADLNKINLSDLINQILYKSVTNRIKKDK